MSSSSPSDFATSAQLSLRTRSASRFDSSPSSAFGKGAIQHVGHDQPEHVIAEKFEALVAVAALARGFQRGDMRERGGQQRGSENLCPMRASSAAAAPWR
jgi:hypothetical protein